MIWPDEPPDTLPVPDDASARVRARWRIALNSRARCSPRQLRPKILHGLLRVEERALHLHLLGLKLIEGSALRRELRAQGGLAGVQVFAERAQAGNRLIRARVGRCDQDRTASRGENVTAVADHVDLKRALLVQGDGTRLHHGRQRVPFGEQRSDLRARALLVEVELVVLALRGVEGRGGGVGLLLRGRYLGFGGSDVAGRGRRGRHGRRYE